MIKTKRFLLTTVLTVLVLSLMGTASGDVSTGKLPDSKPVADEMIGFSGITWVPKTSFAQLTLTVARPDGTIFSKTFDGDTTPYLDLSDLYGDNTCDGTYTYELRITQVSDKKVHIDEGFGIAGKQSGRQKPLTQTGYFRVQGGMIVAKRTPERLDRTSDVIHSDDVIITGGLCVGSDCVSGESFTDTMKLKGYNLSMYFEDTSSSSSETNDWRILINSASSSGEYFSIEDSETARRLFTLGAGAPANSLYVDSYGRVGLGTSVPATDLHIVSGSSPTIQLEQDGSSPSHPAHDWAISCNHMGFAIFDMTNGNKYPFVIEAGCPSNTLALMSGGKVGIGTLTPGYLMHLETTGVNAEFASTRTDGATCYISGGWLRGFFGTKTNHPLRFVANDTWRMELTTDNSLNMKGGASCPLGQVWTNASSITFKENIQTLTANEAVDTLNRLSPVKFNYKSDKTEKYVGFIAEHVPDLVATKDRKGLSPLDIAAVLAKVVQEQQKYISQLKKADQEQRKSISQLNKEDQVLQKSISQLKKEIIELKKSR